MEHGVVLIVLKLAYFYLPPKHIKSIMFSVKRLVESNSLKTIPSNYICHNKNQVDDSMLNETENIPTIDFSKLISSNSNDRSKEIQKLGDACRDWGFFMVQLLKLNQFNICFL
jgi:hypothetical protein